MNKEKKEGYLERMWPQLTEWKNRVEQLKNKTKEIKDGEKAGSYKVIQDLDDRIKRIQRKLQALEFASEGVWQALKEDAEELANSINRDIENPHQD